MTVTLKNEHLELPDWDSNPRPTQMCKYATFRGALPTELSGIIVLMFINNVTVSQIIFKRKILTELEIRSILQILKPFFLNQSLFCDHLLKMPRRLQKRR